MKRLLFCLLVLSITACSTTKKTSSPEDFSSTDGKTDFSLEINGDSDSRRAGDLKTVYFDYRSFAIGAESKKILDQNAEFLITHPSIELQIEGHADERGSAQYNLILGEKRALAVRDYLFLKGVEQRRMVVLSLGKERPLEMGHDEEAWAKNRRANFVVTGK